MVVCDPDITCDGPTVMTFTYAFEYTGGSCLYCSGADDTNICVPLADECDDENVSVIHTLSA